MCNALKCHDENMVGAKVTQEFDVIIAGGGLSGALTACKLLSSLPNAKILILEKEKFSGGRLRTTDKEN